MLTSSSPMNLLSSVPTLSPFTRRGRYRQNYKTAPVSITCSSSADRLTTLGRLLWGPSLPPNLLISAARSAWHATWLLMMRQLAPSSDSSSAPGSYSRPPSLFPSVPEPYFQNPHNKRLRLYAAHACPWAHRALIVLALKNLRLPVSIVTPSEDGVWEVEKGGMRLKDVYMRRRGGYKGRVTVPMLWDEEEEEVVCNESYGIAKFFDRIGGGGETVDLVPEGLEGEIERWNGIVYPNVNNGVYRCGFAQSQEAYNAAAKDLFSTLDILESHLSNSRYLCGDALTLADVCLFTTLIRFDLVYNVLFKCTKKKLIEYPNLRSYTQDIYQIPNVAETCKFEAIMDGYYWILFPLNPGSIRPAMPSVCEFGHLSQPHNREALLTDSKKSQFSAC